MFKVIVVTYHRPSGGINKIVSGCSCHIGVLVCWLEPIWRAEPLRRCHPLSVGWYRLKNPMIEFCSLISRALLPTFRTNCPHGSRFVQMGSNFAQNNTTSSCSLLSHHQPLSKICTYTKHAQTHPKTPLFLSWTCQWAKWTTVHPSWGPFCLKSLSGQNIFRNEQKKISSQNNLCGVLNSF